MKVYVSTVLLFFTFAIIPLNVQSGVNTELFIGEGQDQALIVGFGGAEGGNAWASDYWKETRNKFLQQGYALLAVGYFGLQGAPEKLDRISLNDVFAEIQNALKHPQIDANKVALIGGSKGAELALNLAARYDEIGAVVAIVPSHVSFPGLTMTMSHSSWVFDGEEVPYLPASERVIEPALKGDIHTVFSIMLENKEMENSAAIAVENINGPILIMSAKNDELWPSHMMSNKLVERLKKQGFAHYYQHHVSEGGHSSPLEKFDVIFNFLNEYFNTVSQ